MKKIGKITKRNIEANKKLKLIYLEKGITNCEIRLPDCCFNWALGFAHKKKRVEYLKNPDGLSDFNETLLSCNSCHQKIEGNRKLTEYYFNKLRGK
jgi:hypothetical protein